MSDDAPGSCAAAPRDADGGFDAGSVDDFADGACVAVRTPSGTIAVLRRGDAFTAFDDRCPHRGDPLSAGFFDGGDVICRAHGWRFALADGHCMAGERAARIAIHRCAVVDGRVRVWIGGEFPPASPRL